jgi:hypothetical protein
MENKIYYTINTIADDSFSELDFELYEEVFGKIDYDEFWPESIEDRKYRSVDGHPIQIDRLINLLNSFKENGANYVALHHHCDHIGYDLEAYDIHKSTEEEVNTFFQKEQAAKLEIKQKEIDKLQKELDKLKNG